LRNGIAKNSKIGIFLCSLEEVLAERDADQMRGSRVGSLFDDVVFGLALGKAAKGPIRADECGKSIPANQQYSQDTHE